MVRVRTKVVSVMVAMMAMGMTAKMVVMGKTVTVVLMEVLRFWSIFGIQVARKTWQTNRLLPTIVTDAMLEAVAEQTNLFAQQFIDSHDLARRSQVRQWGWSPHESGGAEEVSCHHHGTHQLPMYRGLLLDHFMAICQRYV